MLVNVIGHLIANTEVQTLMIIAVKIVSYADLGVGQGGKNRPFAQSEYLGFEPGPAALGLRIIVAVAAAALRAQGPVLVVQGVVGLAAVLPNPVGVGGWAEKSRCKALFTSSSGIVPPTCQPTTCQPTTCLVPMP